jgi:hypothetical protein
MQSQNVFTINKRVRVFTNGISLKKGFFFWAGGGVAELNLHVECDVYTQCEGE